MDNIDIKNISNDELLELYKSVNDFIGYLENEIEIQTKTGDSND